MRLWSTLLLLILAVAPALPAAQAHSSSQAPRAVVTHYADGRITHHVIKPEGMSGWTTLFPRMAGTDTDRKGLPLAALEYAMVPAGQDVKVAVTLIYGRPHQQRIAVTTITVTPTGLVRAEELRAYGVDPVSFSIVPVPPSLLKAPAVASVSPLLDVSIELAGDDGPAYRMVVVNQSAQAVRGFGIEGTQAGRKAVSSYRKGPRQAVLIPPGAAISVEVPTSVVRGIGGTTRVSPDRMVISSVAWEDGTIDGDKTHAVIEQVIAAGYVRQLGDVLVLLREAGDLLRPQGLSELRGRIAALPIDASQSNATEADARWLKTGMQQVKELVLRDLDAFVNDPARGSASLWASRTIADYEDWLARAQKASGPVR